MFRAIEGTLWHAGGFGPMAAAWIVTRSTGGSVRTWARQIVEWRVAPRFYLYDCSSGLNAAPVADLVRELRLHAASVNVSCDWPGP